MAEIDDIKSQLRTDPSSFNLDAIKDAPEELQKVIDAIEELVDESIETNEVWERILKKAKQYKRELRESGKFIEEQGNSIQKLGGKIQNFGNRMSAFNEGLLRVGSSVVDTVKKLGDGWGKADQTAYNFGKTIGGNEKAIERLRDESIKFGASQHIGIKYNATIAEMIKVQEDLSKTVGRNLSLSNNQRETLLATSKLMKENTNEFVKRLENMGVGLEKSGEIAAKMYNEASKSGISFERYSKTVTENLTKVQSYGFKNGVEGLTAMAKRSAEVNMNIAEAFKIADKIEKGGVQEAIKMGANLQVLGGSFARFGDPMNMLYEGLNDMEGLQKRMVDMFSGLGQIKDGQVQLSTANRLMVKTAAESLGISSDEMFNMINRQAVRDTVKAQMGERFNRDEELKELVLNTATLNKNNEAVVNVGGKEKRLSEIDARDKQYLKDLQKTESEDIKDIAQMLRGYSDVQEGFGKEAENQRARMFSSVGNSLKTITKKVGESTAFLHTLVTLQTAAAVGNMISGIGGGIRQFGSAFPSNKTTGAGSSNAGSTPPGTPPATPQPASSSVAKFSLKSGAVGGAVAGLTSGAIHLMSGDFSKDADRDRKNKAIGGTIGSALGAGIAMAFGGGAFVAPAAMAGEFVGQLIGGKVTEIQDNRRNEARAKAENELAGKELAAFKNLRGDYNSKDLKKLMEALKDGTVSKNELSDKLLKKIQESGDAELIQKFGSDEMKENFQKVVGKMSAKVEKGEMSIENANVTLNNANINGEKTEKYAAGGEIKGVSHEHGGVFVNAEGGEYIVAKDAVQKNRDVLDYINNGGVIDTKAILSGAISKIKGNTVIREAGNKIMNSDIISKVKGSTVIKEAGNKLSNIAPSFIKNPMVPIKVKNAIDSVKNVGNKLIDKLEIPPIKLDISGTIKLDAGGQQVDLNSIISNPAFVTQLSQIIERRLADNINGGNFKELKKNKQHTFI